MKPGTFMMIWDILPLTHHEKYLGNVAAHLSAFEVTTVWFSALIYLPFFLNQQGLQ